jgi:hypothetical protein
MLLKNALHFLRKTAFLILTIEKLIVNILSYMFGAQDDMGNFETP